MQHCGFGPTVVNRNPNQQVFGRGLGVFDKDIEVTILIKDPCIEQFVLEFISTALPVRFDQVFVGKFTLRVLVQSTSCTSESACCPNRSKSP